jgi:hypothetical protein
MSAFIDKLIHNIMAGVPILRIDTSEENRCILEIQQVAWKLTKGNKLALSDAQKKVVSAALKKAGPRGEGLLEESELLVDGERLHDLLDVVGDKAGDLFSEMVGRVGYKIITWDVVRGFSDSEPTDENSFSQNPQGALLAVTSPERFKGHIIFVFKDCHPFLGSDAQDPMPRRVNLVLKQNKIK